MNFKKRLHLFWIRAMLNILYIISKRMAGKVAFKVFCTPVTQTRNKKISIFNRGKPLEFTVNNTAIKGFFFSAAGSRKILVLHGFSSYCQKFYTYVSALTDKGCQVYIFDAPAHGASGGRQVNALDYSKMVETAAALYGPFDGYLAHSFGGLAVCLALENIPHTAQTKLVLIAPATETTSAINGAFDMLGIKNNNIKEAVKEEIQTISGKPAEWFSIKRAIKNIQATTLWIHDKDDDTTPIEDALAVKKEQPVNVSFTITEGLGHRQVYRDEQVKNTVINFLQAVPYR